MQPKELVRRQVKLKMILHGDIGLINEQVGPF